MKMQKTILAAVFAMGFFFGIVGPITGARANFVLDGTEYLSVTSPHVVGTLLEDSTAVVSQGGYIQDAYVYDNALLRIPESNVRETWVHDTGTVDISGGSIENYLWVYESGTVNMSDGSVPYLLAYDTSNVDISGGSVSESLRVNDNSNVDISSDGSVNYLWVYESSTINISGGSVYCLPTYNYSNVDISGGSVSILSARDTSEITFYGYDFRTLGGLSFDGNRVLGTGTLVGRWFDGTLWSTNIETNQADATILVVPEPATLLLLSLGMVMLRRKR